jgi:hypothetical protein
VHDAKVVSTRERGTHLLDHVDRSLDRHRALRDDARERGADQVLHDEVELAIVRLADVVDLHDVRVIDPVCSARFAQHPGAEMRLAP